MLTGKIYFAGKQGKMARYAKAINKQVRMYLLFFIIIFSAGGSFAGTPIPPARIAVYYFHTTQRSKTSLDIENVSKNAVLTLYPVKVKRGEIFFQSVNLDEKDGAALGAKYKIKKEKLVVILVERQIDLTKKGIRYATDQPEKLTEEIKNAVESLMK